MLIPHLKRCMIPLVFLAEFKNTHKKYLIIAVKIIIKIYL